MFFVEFWGYSLDQSFWQKNHGENVEYLAFVKSLFRTVFPMYQQMLIHCVVLLLLPVKPLFLKKSSQNLGHTTSWRNIYPCHRVLPSTNEHDKQYILLSKSLCKVHTICKHVDGLLLFQIQIQQALALCCHSDRKQTGSPCR